MHEQGVRKSAGIVAIPDTAGLEATINRLLGELRRKEEEHLSISQIHRAVSAHLDHDELF